MTAATRQTALIHTDGMQPILSDVRPLYHGIYLDGEEDAFLGDCQKCSCTDVLTMKPAK